MASRMAFGEEIPGRPGNLDCPGNIGTVTELARGRLPAKAPSLIGGGAEFEIDGSAGDDFPVAQPASVERLAVVFRGLEVTLAGAVAVVGDDEFAVLAINRI